MANNTCLLDNAEAEEFFAEDRAFAVGDLARLLYLPDGELLQEDWRIAALLDAPEFADVDWKADISGIVTRVNEDAQFEVWVTVYRRPFSLYSVYELIFQSDSFNLE